MTNCILCNVPQADIEKHLVVDHRRSRAEAAAMIPEKTGRERCLEKFTTGTVLPDEPALPPDDDLGGITCVASIATKIGDRVAVLIGRTEFPDGKKLYYWRSGYVTEVYHTQTVVALDERYAGRSHLRRASRFVRVIS